jgi:nitrous oxide reductase
VTLPVHAPTDPKLLAQADLAYADRLGPGFVVDDTSLAVAQGFAKLYNTCGVSKCAIMPTLDCSLNTAPIFAVFAACRLMDWPKFKDIRSSKGDTWSLGVAAAKEIQELSIHGEAGRRAAEATTEDGFAAQLAAMEEQMLPLDLQESNRFHHGEKVSAQDRELLRACLAYGEGDSKTMSSPRKLLRGVGTHRGRKS